MQMIELDVLKDLYCSCIESDITYQADGDTIDICKVFEDIR